MSRRKTATYAVSAAVATAPVWPSLAGGADLSKNDVSRKAKKLRHDHIERVLLSRGDSNSAVLELQKALRIPADSIYGPQTEAAVRAYQKQVGLPVTGDVDVRTWLKLFPTDMIVYAPPHAAAALGGSHTSGAQWTAVNAAEVARAAGASDDAVGHAKGATVRAASVIPGLDDAPDAEGGPVGIQLPTGAPAPDVGGPQSPPGGGAPGPGGVPGPAPIPFPHNGTVGEMVSAMLSAANQIDSRHFAYRWGGGHNPGFSGPYDCSGAVSAVLHAAGLLKAPLVSGDFMHWGAPGKGAVTIYANAGHVYMSILGRYFGTTHANPGGGAGWFRGGPRPGFAVIHVPFERMHFRNRSAERRRAKRIARRRARTQQPQATTPESTYSPGSGGSGYSQEGSSQTPSSPPSSQPPASQTAPAPASPAPTTGTPGVSGPAPAAPVQPAPPVSGPPPSSGPPAPAAAPTGDQQGSNGTAPAAAPQAPAPAPAQPVSAPQAPAAPAAPAPAPVEQSTPAAPAPGAGQGTPGAGEAGHSAPAGSSGTPAGEAAGSQPAKAPTDSGASSGSTG